MKFKCKYCNLEVERKNKKKGFCSKKCSSSFYMLNGTYKKVAPRPFKIENRECLNCGEIFSCRPSNTRKTCSKKCRNENISKTKKALGLKPIKKCYKTLEEKYGVKNPFALAKHVSLSRPQKEIISLLKENTDYTIYFDYPIYKENKLYKVDIYIKEINKIIEFNGTYWHADPRFYRGDYYHQKKKKNAKQIWEEDEKRIKDLEELGYDVEVIWEHDYKKYNQKKETILELLNE